MSESGHSLHHLTRIFTAANITFVKRKQTKTTRKHLHERLLLVQSGRFTPELEKIVGRNLFRVSENKVEKSSAARVDVALKALNRRPCGCALERSWAETQQQDVMRRELCI